MARRAGRGHAARWRGRHQAGQAPAPDDPTTLSIAGLADAFAAGRLTPIDVTAAYLARIDRENPALGAFVTVTRDRAVDDTRRAADAAGGRRRAPGRSPACRSPTRTSSRRAASARPAARGCYEQWMSRTRRRRSSRASPTAGTVLLGKTNTHELGGGVTTINPFFGTTHNPRDVTRIAGGSSGGSAAAVAARLALVATGSDTGGSVRIPAAFCGCVGLKPTFGLRAHDGLLGACPTFDHVGVLHAHGRGRGSDARRDGRGRRGSGTRRCRRRRSSPAYRAAARAATCGACASACRAPTSSTGLDPDVARAVDARARSAARRRRRACATSRCRCRRALYDTMFAPIAVSEIRATYAARLARASRRVLARLRRGVRRPRSRRPPTSRRPATRAPRSSAR